jgi:2-keto-3-deoxy-L-fuconate dehydrogenase
MSSVCSSLKGLPNRFTYGATKAAVIGMTKSVAADYIRKGIRCNAICPGTIRSPSWDARVNSAPDPKAALKNFIARQPMGRIGEPEEVAALCVYLASDEAAYTTGAVHVIDGGWTM